MTASLRLAMMHIAEAAAGRPPPSRGHGLPKGGYRVKVQAASRRPAADAKQPRTATPPWRKRRRGPARHTTISNQPAGDGASGATALAAPTLPLALLGSAAERLRKRFAALPAAVRRLQAATVPIEPVPAAWTPVGVMEFGAPPAAMAPIDPAEHPATVPAAISLAAPLAVVAVDGDVASAGPGRHAGVTPARSIKGGPPKAPRPRRGFQPPLGPVSLPDGVVPVMAAEAVAANTPADDAPPQRPPSVLPGLFTTAEPLAAITLMPIVVAHPITDGPNKRGVIDPGQDLGVERARSTLAQRIGDDAERLAAIRLEALGWRIIARNLRISRAEIDLLAIDPAEPPMLVIVEVRRRNRRDFGLAEETVDYRKRAMLRRAAGELAMRATLPDGRRLPALPVRVDLVAIDRGPDGRPSLRHHQGIDT